MKKLIHIVLICCMVSMMSCSKDSSRIGHEDMAHIYADMLMRDQWINSNYEERAKADTSFVYGTILEDYGYSREDFNEAVAFYVDHPEVLNKIMDRCVQLLDGRILVVENMIKQRDNFRTDSLARIRKIRRLDSIRHSVPPPHWNFADSLYVPEKPGDYYPAVLSRNEVTWRKILKRNQRSDSLARVQHVADSLRADSLKLVVERADSLRLDSLYRAFKGDSSAVKKFEKNRIKADSLQQIKEHFLDSVLYGPLRKGFRPDPAVLRRLVREKAIADSIARARRDSTLAAAQEAASTEVDADADSLKKDR